MTAGRHARSRPWWRQTPVLGVAVFAVLAAGGGALAVTRGPSAAATRRHAAAMEAFRAQQAAAVLQAQEARLVAGLTVTPASGASGVPLDAAVSLSASSGAITAVKATPPLAGVLSPGGTGWRSTTPLQPSTSYTVAATIASGGVTANRSFTFTTLTPSLLVTASLYPSPGMSVGVAQPIVVRFDHYVSDPAVQKAIESRFTVAESNPVPGGWYWFSEYELHFRPEAFWPAHEQISVSADLDGIDAGAGRWTAGSVSSSFSTGDARISYANLDTEQMTVTDNGRTLYVFPISGGRTQYPTMDGIHIVLDRESVVHMVSSTVGIPVDSPDGYDEYVYDDVHISDSGEYVHAAPWSVSSQGRANVSHGCINVSPSNALTFFDFSRVGDVVEVTGSPRPPAYGDHGVMDWSTPWPQWSPGRVVKLN